MTVGSAFTAAEAQAAGDDSPMSSSSEGRRAGPEQHGLPAHKGLPLLGPTRVRPGGFRGPGERTAGPPGGPRPVGCRPAPAGTSWLDTTPLMTPNLRDSLGGNS